MSGMKTRFPIYLLLGLSLAACGRSEAPGARPAVGPANTGSRPAIERTLILMALQVPTDFAGRPLGGGVSGRAINIPQIIFNAGLVTANDVGNSLPVLADSTPQLNTDSWRVYPDGSMETTYRLKPNLTWHDGQPLTAEDFVFAWQVYGTPEYGVSSVVPMRYISEALAPDARTVVMKWTQRYVDAGILGREFSPLPRHLLEQQHSKSIGTGASSPDFLPNSPFWNTGYVGAGPYKVDSYTPGVSIEASAFDAFVLGRPKINTVSIRGMADVNTALATILAGEAHMSFGHFTGETGEILLQRWGATGGTILWEPQFSRTLDIQFRPERAQPLELASDVRVRQAVAHAIDKQPIFEAIAYGRGFLTDTFTPPQMDIYPLVERAVAKYPYDPRRVQQLLEAAGFLRGSDGRWATPRGTPFDLPIWYTAGATNFQQENFFIQHKSHQM
jgi:peptide/nickel transport system substrate-binding protein